jgi:hypothetical protein
MAFRFNRRIKVLPGVRLNLNKTGASVSVGREGMWCTAGTHGRRATVGLPGTGLYWTEKLGTKKTGPAAALALSPPAPKKTSDWKIFFWVVVAITLALWLL